MPPSDHDGTTRCPHCRSTDVSDEPSMNLLVCSDCGKYFQRAGYDNNLLDDEDEDEDDESDAV